MNVGDLFWGMRADSRQLELDAKKGGIKAGDVAGKSFGAKFKAQLTKANLGKGIAQGLGLGAGLGVVSLLAGGIGKVVDILGDAVRAAAEEEAAIAQLTTSIKANDSAWDGNIDRIEDVIAARQDLAFADDEQRDSLRQLVAVTHDVDEALALQAVAMDLARLKNMSLVDAGNLLGKVYGGNIGILKRYGIQLDKGATSTEAIAAIQKMASGQAAAYAGKPMGDLIRSQIELDNAMEDLGRTLTPVVAGLANLAADVIPPIVAGIAAIVEEMEPLMDLMPGSDARWDSWSEKIIEAGAGAGMTSEEIQQLTADMLLADTANGQYIEHLGRAGSETERNAVLQHMLDEALRDYIPTAIAAGKATGAAVEAAKPMGPVFLEAAKAVAALVNRAADGVREIFDLAEQVDLAKGSFKSFWDSIREQQRRVQFFIRNPGKLQEELDKIERQIRQAEEKKGRLMSVAAERRNVAAIAAQDRLIRDLKAKADEWRSLGIVYGNAAERGVETAFDPALRKPVVMGGRGAPREIPRASGGTMRAGLSYVLGERGREVVDMGWGGNAYAHDAEASAPIIERQSRGDTTIHLTTQGMPMRAETPGEIVRRLRRASRMGVLVPS